jgi:acetylornithine/succinyldiaminopimelate/putrescine aminotransferase
MSVLTADPVLGHLTTFGGHPVCCAAGMAALQVLYDEHIVENVPNKEKKFLSLLKHPAIKQVRSVGLLMAVDLDDAGHVQQTLHRCLEKGLFSDWFLFAPGCIRIAPPLTITDAEIEQACEILLSCL